MRPWHKPSPTDIIAGMCIIIAGLAIIRNADPQIASSLLLIAGYYFGKKASTLPPPEPPNSQGG